MLQLNGPSQSRNVVITLTNI